MDIVNALEMLRFDILAPIIIASGTRCSAHNKAVKGSVNSHHLTGDAVDIRCLTSRDRHILLSRLIHLFPFVEIGKDYIHVSNISDKPYKVISLSRRLKGGDFSNG